MIHDNLITTRKYLNRKVVSDQTPCLQGNLIVSMTSKTHKQSQAKSSVYVCGMALNKTCSF